MKIKIYIVTYNNNDILNDWALKSLFESDLPISNSEIYVINNHSNILIQPDYIEKVNILNNSLRPDFSTGHLSRNWNQAIINGFKSLSEPDCDLVIACQNDTIFCKNWYSKLLINLFKFNYISVGVGDQLQAFTVDAVKNIGLYDERFCNIAYQEADYFLRSLIYYSDYSSINDYTHDRILNPLSCQIIENTESGFARKEISHFSSMKYHEISERFWNLKWEINPLSWQNIEDIKNNIKPKIKNYILYPYFEKDILDLEEKYY